MSFKIEDYIPDTAPFLKKLPARDFKYLATAISIPNFGKVWYLNKSLAGLLNGYQYAIMHEGKYIKAESYPLGSFLIISSETKKLVVVRSILLTYKDDRIIARRRSISGYPAWELLDSKIKKQYTDIQAMLMVDTPFYAECFAEKTHLIKHTSLKRTLVIDANLKQKSEDKSPEFEQLTTLKLSTHLKPLFKKYFDLKDDSLHFLDIPRSEKTKLSGSNFYEVFAIGAILFSLKEEGYNLEKEIAIITPFDVQKHILSDFYADTIASESKNPKIALPHEILKRKFSVIICSMVVSSRSENYKPIEHQEHNIRKVMENAHDGMLFVGNLKTLSMIHGFPRDLTELAKSLKKIQKISKWINAETYAEPMIKIWQNPIKKMNPDKISDKLQKSILAKLYGSIQFEYQKEQVPAMISLYKDYLRTLGIGRRR